MPLIEIKNLRKTYTDLLGRKPTTAVDGIDLEVRTGEIFGLLGPNGAGKTTTIKMMAGLVKPTSGSIAIDGLCLARKRQQALRGIGAVLEGTRNVYWRLTPEENLYYYANLRGLTNRQARPGIDSLLEQFGLGDKRKTIVQKLSRGMQQKTAIAVSLIHEPKCLLLDEPTLGLDVESSAIVKERVRGLVTGGGRSIVLTTHQMDVAQELCDRVAIIKKGRIVACDTVKNLLKVFSVEQYRLRLEGRIADRMQSLFAGWNPASASVDDGHTQLMITLKNPDEVYLMMDKLRTAGARILSLDKVEPDLEEVFLNIIRSKDERAEA